MSDLKYAFDDASEESRYLLFSLGNELYGTPLLGVREVVEMQEPKPVPNTVKHFLGVINIRGEIVGVLDLRARFGQPSSSKRGSALMVFTTEGGPMAALVDKVEAVVQIERSKIERSPNVQTSIPTPFLLGIAHSQDRLVTLIDLDKTLQNEEVTQISNHTK